MTRRAEIWGLRRRQRLLAWAVALLALSAVLAPAPAAAHVTEIAVVRLSEVTPGRFTISWELRPTRKDALAPIFPPHCEADERFVRCGERGLAGELGFDEMGAGQSAAMFKIRRLDGSTQVYTLTPVEPSVWVSPSFTADTWAGKLEIAGSYFWIGVEHILLGVDHLLFVLGLMWISRTAWMLFKTITAFTVAHSFTLGAVAFGWVGVPELFVNTMIALSIAFIGVEAVYAHRGRDSFTLRNPWLVSFAFGLLHGFGFANALIQLGLPEQAVPLALVAFNLGVEVGQIAFVFMVLALVWAFRSVGVVWPRWSVLAPAYAIGGLAMFWFYDRFAVLMEV